MDNAGYVALTRQSGLLREMQAVAHNIANLATTGYRQERVVFSEHVRALGRSDPSLSMAHANGRSIAQTQGALERTGGSFDFAIEGEGFFLLQTPAGERLTRAGAFTPNEAGELVTPEGDFLLDEGGAPIFVPPDGGPVGLAADGTLSVDGQPLARVGLVRPIDPLGLSREAGVLFSAPDGVEPAEEARVLQGFLESSNVEPVREIARMIEVQRAYELGQTLLDREDERIRAVVQTLGR